MSKQRRRRPTERSRATSAPPIDRNPPGYHEIRLTGPGREQFRLVCLLENGSDEELRRRGLARPAIAALDGRRKPWRTTLTARDYRQIKQLGDDHKQQYPRRIAT